jgi:hypothetical protein
MHLGLGGGLVQWLVYAPAGIAAATALLAIRRWLFPSPPTVLISPPSGRLEAHRDEWVSAEVGYAIQNESDSPIYDVATGVRTADGTEHTFLFTSIPLIAGRSEQRLSGMKIPLFVLRHLRATETPVRTTYWARFRDGKGRAWEVRYEAPDPVPHYRRLRRRHFSSRLWAVDPRHDHG